MSVYGLIDVVNIGNGLSGYGFFISSNKLLTAEVFCNPSDKMYLRLPSVGTDGKRPISIEKPVKIDPKIIKKVGLGIILINVSRVYMPILRWSSSPLDKPPDLEDVPTGSPILNKKNEVTGVCICGEFVSSRTLEKLLQPTAQVILQAKITNMLGFTYEPFDTFYSAFYSGGLVPNEGVVVTSVVENGPMCLAGIKPGYILVKINGKPVTEETQYVSTTSCEFYGGTTVEIKTSLPTSSAL